MNHLIIGAGPAGVIAAETLRKLAPESTITLIGDEPEPPYSRMAIPYLLAGHIDEPGTYLRHGDDHYAKLGIARRTGRVTRISPRDHGVTFDGGDTLGYERLLIASGAHPVRPPVPGIDLPGVESCWTLADARDIAARAVPGSEVVLLGAGFIGCIVLEALSARKVALSVVEMEDRMLPRMMDDAGADMIRRWCESKGVRVLTSTRVTGIEVAGGGLRLALDGHEPLNAALVVCATGVRSNIGFLEYSGIQTDTGILVDERMRTNVEDVYAAGDVAQGIVFSTGAREVHAIQPTASEHGRVAARNMAGMDTRFNGSLSMNVLNTLGLVSSSFGLWSGVDGGERAVATDPGRFKYLRLEFAGDRLVGALALGLTHHVGILRGLIQTRVRLGEWKDRLMTDPHQIMHAYLECTQGTT